MKPATKSPNLPKPIAAYFTADKGDAGAVGQCFTEDAVVRDEGHTYKGRAAIEKWKTDASAKYDYTSEPFACEEKDGKTTSPAIWLETFPAVRSTSDTFSGWKGTGLRPWRSSRRQRRIARQSMKAIQG